MAPRRALAGLVAALLALAAQGAATSARQEIPVFTAHSDLVVLQVAVEDRRGASVGGLGVEAFRVFDNGRPQAIEFFAAQDAPVTVGLIVDTSGSMLRMASEVAVAVASFVQTSNPEDEVFALTFSQHVRSVLPPAAPFTSDPATLRQAISPHLAAARGTTALYDAILAGLDYVNRGRHQRRVLVVVADGGDNASVATLEEVLGRVEAGDVLVYALAIADPLSRERDPERLERLAEATGGEDFSPDAIDEVPAALRHIARDIRSMYTIGYVPDSTATGTFRRVHVDARVPGQRGLRVRTREGYRVEEER